MKGLYSVINNQQEEFSLIYDKQKDKPIISDNINLIPEIVKANELLLPAEAISEMISLWATSQTRLEYEKLAEMYRYRTAYWWLDGLPLVDGYRTLNADGDKIKVELAVVLMALQEGLEAPVIINNPKNANEFITTAYMRSLITHNESSPVKVIGISDELTKQIGIVFKLAVDVLRDEKYNPEKHLFS
ncbi:hypothetical protein B4900_17805 [Yersinia rohdei]|nr:hypothetical protein B4900_17805 [Yersinia rohdei]